MEILQKDAKVVSQAFTGNNYRFTPIEQPDGSIHWTAFLQAYGTWVDMIKENSWSQEKIQRKMKELQALGKLKHQVTFEVSNKQFELSVKVES